LLKLFDTSRALAAQGSKQEHENRIYYTPPHFHAIGGRHAP
jgi:hypothetical protein